MNRITLSIHLYFVNTSDSAGATKLVLHVTSPTRFDTCGFIQYFCKFWQCLLVPHVRTKRLPFIDECISWERQIDSPLLQVLGFAPARQSSALTVLKHRRHRRFSPEKKKYGKGRLKKCNKIICQEVAFRFVKMPSSTQLLNQCRFEFAKHFNHFCPELYEYFRHMEASPVDAQGVVYPL